MRIRPSGLALTVACNASLQLQESVPPLPDTEEEAEGTAAHWVARRYLAGYGAELPVGAKFMSDGREWEVDQDMMSGAALYVHALGGYHPSMRIEQSVKVQRIHFSECGGTPDGARFFEDAREAYPLRCPEGLPVEKFNAGRIKLLRIGDYKYGHRYVEVFENFQLVAYAEGVGVELGLSEMDDDYYVELVLVQPRSYHPDGPVRVWRTKAINLRNTLIEAQDGADRALMPLGEPMAPKAMTGRHCIDCKARHVCVALQTNTASIVDYSQTAERVELPALALGQELAILDEALARLTARRTGLAAQGEAMLRGGQQVPFYHMEAGGSKLTYFENVKADELVGLGDLIGIDLRRRLALKDQIVTPTQAIQLGIDEAVMKNYAARPPAALKFARDNTVKARKVFSK